MSSRTGHDNWLLCLNVITPDQVLLKPFRMSPSLPLKRKAHCYATRVGDDHRTAYPPLCHYRSAWASCSSLSRSMPSHPCGKQALRRRVRRYGVVIAFHDGFVVASGVYGLLIVFHDKMCGHHSPLIVPTASADTLKSSNSEAVTVESPATYLALVASPQDSCIWLCSDIHLRRRACSSCSFF
jgi:hypothetical protein